MDRPPFDNLKPDYYRSVQYVMEIVSDLLYAAPDSTEVFFGKIGGTHAINPNYQVTCHGRSFVFLGANHLPYPNPVEYLQPYQPNQLREGPFDRSNLEPPRRPTGPKPRTAVGHTPISTVTREYAPENPASLDATEARDAMVPFLEPARVGFRNGPRGGSPGPDLANTFHIRTLRASTASQLSCDQFSPRIG
jgi:hypothetical protein